MDVRIISKEENSVTLECGNKTYEIYDNGFSINVCCRNASNNAFNRGIGGGRQFDSYFQAIAGYKSTAAKVAIETAMSILTEVKPLSVPTEMVNEELIFVGQDSDGLAIFDNVFVL